MNSVKGAEILSSNSCMAGDVPDQFPAGLRVLVVDDDPTCLMILEKMLQKCSYQVTACTRAADALSMLRKRKDGFDIVISDVHMPDMDGFKLLEHIGLEMDLSVIMMSADDSKDVVMKGVTHGACDYLIKPVRSEAIKNIWQHVIRKKRHELRELDHSGSIEDSDKSRKPLDDADYSSSANEGNWKSSKRRMDAKDEEDEGEERDDSSTLKKPRVVWSIELHQQFVAAVNQLGIDKAVPKKILELMNVPGLTRENVASHLQKYRLYLRRLSGVSRHQGGVNPPFVGAQEAAFGSVSSLDGLNLQVLAVSGQLPPQSLVTLPAGFGRTTSNTGMGMTVVDQRNLFNSERQIVNSPTVRYGSGQQLSNNKQVNLLHGLPTTIEPEQLRLHPSIQSFGTIGLQVSEGIPGFLTLPTSVRRGSSSHGDTNQGHHNGSLMMQMSQQRPHMISNEIAGQVFGRNRTILNGRGTSSDGTSMNPSYGPVSRTSSVDFPINPIAELPGNGFSLPSLPPSTGCLEGINNATNGKGGPRGAFIPSYDLFNEFDQIKSPNWDLQNVNLAFGATQPVNSIQSGLDFCPSFMGDQSFTAIQKNVQNGNMSNVGKGVLSLPLRQEDGHGSLESIAQLHNNLVDDNSFRIKTESNLSSQNALITEHFVQDDLMNVLLKQQPGAEPVDCDFNFDG